MAHVDPDFRPASPNQQDAFYTILGLYRDNGNRTETIILGLYCDTGKENGNYYS